LLGLILPPEAVAICPTAKIRKPSAANILSGVNISIVVFSTFRTWPATNLARSGREATTNTKFINIGYRYGRGRQGEGVRGRWICSFILDKWYNWI
jgi:hypothetical protein